MIVWVEQAVPHQKRVCRRRGEPSVAKESGPMRETVARAIASRNGDAPDATSKPSAACGEPVVVGPNREAGVGPSRETVVPIAPG
jgi:hypothetical protein